MASSDADFLTLCEKYIEQGEKANAGHVPIPEKCSLIEKGVLEKCDVDDCSDAMEFLENNGQHCVYVELRKIKKLASKIRSAQKQSTVFHCGDVNGQLTFHSSLDQLLDNQMLVLENYHTFSGRNDMDTGV